MAKRRRRKINKSQAIRDYLATNPSATPSAIKEALAEKGIKVGASLISQVKYKPGVTKGKRKRRAMAGRPAGRRGEAVDIEMLVAAKAIADKLGGVARAKEALTLLERLQ
jgi:hypothetical protein